MNLKINGKNKLKIRKTNLINASSKINLHSFSIKKFLANIYAKSPLRKTSKIQLIKANTCGTVKLSSVISQTRLNNTFTNKLFLKIPDLLSLKNLLNTNNLNKDVKIAKHRFISVRDF